MLELDDESKIIFKAIID